MCITRFSVTGITFITVQVDGTVIFLLCTFSWPRPFDFWQRKGTPDVIEKVR